jgi:very-short-patch-repair endonuclease
LRSGKVVVHRCADLARADRVIVDGIPCTAATRTIIDLAASLEDEALETAFQSARRMGLTSVKRLARSAAALGGQGRAGSAAIRRLVANQDERALASRLEVRCERLLRSSRLPRPARQHPVARFHLDFAWVSLMTAVECDGFDWHGSRMQWKRDRRRVAAIEALGWQILFVTWDDVTKHREETLQRIEHALARVT